jgi:hypothetical protein
VTITLCYFAQVFPINGAYQVTPVNQPVLFDALPLVLTWSLHLPLHYSSCHTLRSSPSRLPAKNPLHHITIRIWVSVNRQRNGRLLPLFCAAFPHSAEAAARRPNGLRDARHMTAPKFVQLRVILESDQRDYYGKKAKDVILCTRNESAYLLHKVCFPCLSHPHKWAYLASLSNYVHLEP